MQPVPFSALSYSELAARFPDAGGEVVYLDQAYGIQALSLGVVSLIAAAGVLSAAAIARGFAGYVQVFWNAPTSLILVLALVALGAAAIRGVRQSLFIAAAFTIMEVAGSLPVMAIGAHDDQIHLLIGGARQHHAAHRNALCFNVFHLSLDTMAVRWRLMSALGISPSAPDPSGELMAGTCTALARSSKGRASWMAAWPPR